MPCLFSYVSFFQSIPSRFCCALIITFVFITPAAAEQREVKRFSTEYELDPYYSNISLYINTTDQPIREAGKMSELEIYRELLKSSLLPRIIILEAAVYPMPDLGVYLKEQVPGIFDVAQVSSDINLVKAITAGFEEPYSVAGFFGNVIKFSRHNDERGTGNFGYMGFLVGFAQYHIKDNELIRDDNMEIEWKIKGDRAFPDHQLSWSFRIGTKLHAHEHIRNSNYLSLRRSSIDFNGHTPSLFKNAGIEYTVHLDRENFQPQRHFFLIDKKFPMSSSKIAFSMGIGFVVENTNRYTGPLATDNDEDKFQLILRPNINF